MKKQLYVCLISVFLLSGLSLALAEIRSPKKLIEVVGPVCVMQFERPDQPPLARVIIEGGSVYVVSRYQQESHTREKRTGYGNDTDRNSKNKTQGRELCVRRSVSVARKLGI